MTNYILYMFVLVKGNLLKRKSHETLAIKAIDA